MESLIRRIGVGEVVTTEEVRNIIAGVKRGDLAVFVSKLGLMSKMAAYATRVEKVVEIAVKAVCELRTEASMGPVDAEIIGKLLSACASTPVVEIVDTPEVKSIVVKESSEEIVEEGSVDISAEFNRLANTFARHLLDMRRAFKDEGCDFSVISSEVSALFIEGEFNSFKFVKAVKSPFGFRFLVGEELYTICVWEEPKHYCLSVYNNKTNVRVHFSTMVFVSGKLTMASL